MPRKNCYTASPTGGAETLAFLCFAESNWSVWVLPEQMQPYLPGLLIWDVLKNHLIIKSFLHCKVMLSRSQFPRPEVSHSMRFRTVVVLLLVLLGGTSLWAGLGSDKTMYVGGTVPSLKEGVQGKSSTGDDKVFSFTYKGGTLKVPYDRVNDLEYG